MSYVAALRWASLSFIFHVLTTHPQKNKLFSGYLVACCFSEEDARAWFARERRISEAFRLSCTMAFHK